MSPAIVLESTLTCPHCGHVATETMPTDACQWFYECEQCHTVLKRELLERHRAAGNAVHSQRCAPPHSMSCSPASAS